MIRIMQILLRMTVTGAMVAAALAVGVALWHYYTEAPWTRDGRVRADIVEVAPDVSGLVTEVEVEDNQKVARGDVLFRIDPQRFVIALRQAEAVVEGRKATVEQTETDYARYRKLSDAVVTAQKLEEVQAADLRAKAAYDQAVADRDLARLNLDRSVIRASVAGRITNMELRPGNYVTTGKGVMALVDKETLRVEGYFEETKLAHIRTGAPAVIHLMGERTPLTGEVESIAGAIEDRERTAGSSLVANINPTFAWVRLAQRIPVRLRLNNIPTGIALIPGRTATVSIEAGHDDRPGTLLEYLQPRFLRSWLRRPFD